MLLMPNKKKIATLIVGSMKPKSKSDDFVQRLGEESNTGEFKVPGKDDDQGEEGMELSAVAEAVMEAFDKKDPKAFAQAFKDLVYLCNQDEEKGEQESEG